ncbi:DMT family transporter [Saccharopolyspora sp. HNM0986]|uniref:DMT family transporter n=2 Tax=Saccharopolyspora TaxID=1835 RepID=UPI0019092D55|nr:DMT family transporter [Saccharopolyspora sp. HNM0986]MBK0869585.1 DMT family transporter [Saccharopolyspora sp. HNM0986]
MLGVLLMVVAAFLNAAASVLQRRAAKEEPESAGFSWQMMWDLARRPVWFLGICTMIFGFLLHAVSISVSRISLVQPLLVTELPFTLLLASWVFRAPLPRAVLWAILLQSAGLALFVGTLSPTGGNPSAVSAGTWALGIAITAAIIAALVVGGYRSRLEHRAAMLGVATGVTFGLNSSLIAGVGAAVERGAPLLTTWQTYGVAVLAPISFFLLQNSLQAGNLAASQPGFTLMNPLTSVVWGLVVFGEQSRQGVFLIGVVAGAVLIAIGTVLLARSPLLDPEATQRQRYGSTPPG